MFRNLFFENRAVYEIKGKNVVERCRPQMTIWRMRTACWIPKTINTHSEYVTVIPFPRQQWLRERISMLRYTCIACLVFFHRLVYKGKDKEKDRNIRGRVKQKLRKKREGVEDENYRKSQSLEGRRKGSERGNKGKSKISIKWLGVGEGNNARDGWGRRERMRTQEGGGTVQHNSRLYNCTTVILYNCNIVIQYNCNIVILYNCNTVILYNCTTVILYNCTTVILYNCHHVQL